jgi:hypothetical protein
MKKYLFGLGAMLIGAGLMFVFTHTAVSADKITLKMPPEMPPVYKENIDCHLYRTYLGGYDYPYEYCKMEDLTCVSHYSGISCVKSG